MRYCSYCDKMACSHTPACQLRMQLNAILHWDQKIKFLTNTLWDSIKQGSKTYFMLL